MISISLLLVTRFTTFVALKSTKRQRLFLYIGTNYKEMAPMKRASSLNLSNVEEDVPAKRLRGGNGPPDEEDYFLDDDIPDVLEPPEEFDPPSKQQSVYSDITEDMHRRWLRPANQVTNNSQDLSLQAFDMDMIGGTPLARNPNESKSQVVGSISGQVPVIRAYGVSEVGNSVAVFIHGFTPYGYFALPEHATFHHTEDNLAKIRLLINKRLEGAARGAPLSEYCRAVNYVTSHKSIMGYESSHKHFFKVHVAMPTLIPSLKRIMEEGIELSGVTCESSNEYHAFECNVPFVLRYMIDKDISGAGWMTLPKKAYQVRAESKKQTHCQVCIQIYSSQDGHFYWSSHLCPCRLLS
jgi:DNA polymerase delta subunit 1